MLNHITIMGRLTRDPELRRTGSGIAVASFTVAVDRDYAEQGKEKETDFIDCVAWRQTGEFVSKYFTKGRMIIVSGRLQVRNWTDKEGNKRRSAEVVADNCYFGDSKKNDDAPQGANNGYNQNGGNAAPGGYPGYGAPAYGGPADPAGYPAYGAPAPGGYPGYGAPTYGAPADPAGGAYSNAGGGAYGDFGMPDEAQLPY